jgi:hypothetical protein
MSASNLQIIGYTIAANSSDMGFYFADGTKPVSKPDDFARSPLDIVEATIPNSMSKKEVIFSMIDSVNLGGFATKQEAYRLFLDAAETVIGLDSLKAQLTQLINNSDTESAIKQAKEPSYKKKKETLEDMGYVFSQDFDGPEKFTWESAKNGDANQTFNSMDEMIDAAWAQHNQKMVFMFFFDPENDSVIRPKDLAESPKLGWLAIDQAWINRLHNLVDVAKAQKIQSLSFDQAINWVGVDSVLGEGEGEALDDVKVTVDLSGDAASFVLTQIGKQHEFEINSPRMEIRFLQEEFDKAITSNKTVVHNFPLIHFRTLLDSILTCHSFTQIRNDDGVIQYVYAQSFNFEHAQAMLRARGLDVIPNSTCDVITIEGQKTHVRKSDGRNYDFMTEDESKEQCIYFKF